MFHTKPIVDGFRNEIASPSNAARQALFGNLEAALERTLKLIAEFKANKGPKIAEPLAGPGRVRSLVAFHEGAQADTVRLDQLNALVIKLRIWLHRQGAVLTRD